MSEQNTTDLKPKEEKTSTPGQEKEKTLPESSEKDKKPEQTIAPAETPVVNDEGTLIGPPADHPNPAQWWEDEARKHHTTASNYKKENEKYRGKKGDERANDIVTEEVGEQTIQTTLAPTTPPPAYNPSQLTQSERDALTVNFADKFKEFITSKNIKEKLERLPDDEYKTWKEEWADRASLLNRALETGSPVTNSEIQKRFDSCYEVATKDSTNAQEAARQQGAADVANAEAGDIGSTRSLPPSSSNLIITDADKQASEETGGKISAQRIAEIRKNKEERAKEFNPRNR